MVSSRPAVFMNGAQRQEIVPNGEVTECTQFKQNWNTLMWCTHISAVCAWGMLCAEPSKHLGNALCAVEWVLSKYLVLTQLWLVAKCCHGVAMVIQCWCYVSQVCVCTQVLHLLIGLWAAGCWLRSNQSDCCICPWTISLCQISFVRFSSMLLHRPQIGDDMCL